MVEFHVRHRRHGGRGGEEGVSVFTRLIDENVPLPRPKGRVSLHHSAAKDGGRPPRRAEDLPHHGSDRAFPVGPRDADAHGKEAAEKAKEIGAGINGDPISPRAAKFG